MNTQSTNKYRELEDRMTTFAINVIRCCKSIPRNRINDPLVSQVVRSSGSIGANYREANEAIGKKDFQYRLRIARKEAKETHHWLTLLKEPNLSCDVGALQQEVDELRNILSAIIGKVSSG